MFKILYNSEQIRKEIIRIFSTAKGKRIAISAFVGDGADTYLPKPKGIILYCWPQAGGTNPNMLRKLDKSGVKIHFVNRLHAKVYWAENSHAIITSANLSRNALGVDNLHEFGILLDSKKIDINKTIHTLHAYPITKAKMRDLDNKHDRIARKGTYINISDSIKFNDWYTDKYHKKWKLGWWDTPRSFSKTAIEKTKNLYNRDPVDFISCNKKDYSGDDWILTYRLKGIKVSQIKWLYVDFIIKIPRSDKKAYEKEYPYDATQATPLKDHSTPPFKNNKKFKMAFINAIRNFKSNNMEKMVVPTKAFMKKIYTYYK